MAKRKLDIIYASFIQIWLVKYVKQNLDSILMKKGFPMFFIPFEKREEYYQSLDIADKGDYKGYISRILHLIIDQIRSYGHNKKE